MNSIKLRIAAKTDVGLVRDNNEDNFQASSDLSIEPMRWVNNEICSLGEKGALLVVADGMGGMNAGEVASELAIETVRSAFRPQNLTEEVMKNRFSIEKFMNSVIVDADKRIKTEAKTHPESRGMGTTIVIAWLLNGKLYVSWCGDSRAYIYNPQAGLHQITKDHSYVQSLIDKGSISKEDAFDYPESNIITRCLSDSPTKAKPESLLQPYDICNNDIIILCTDGLNGMIRDNEIEKIIRQNEHDMDVCSDVLIRAACDAEGSDNITICMCQILQGADVCNPKVFEAFDKRLAGPSHISEKITDIISTKITKSGNSWNKVLLFVVILFLLIAIVLGYAYKKGMFGTKANSTADVNINVQKTEKVVTQTIPAVNGSHFIIERGEGNPQVGDRAYPDGKYILDAQTTVFIKDSTIVSIDVNEKKDEIKEEKVGSGVSSKDVGERGKKSQPKGSKGGIFDDFPKSGEKPEGSSAQKDDSGTDGGVLTPVKNTNYVNKVHEVKTDETLFSIGQMYGITADDIRKMNPSLSGDKIKPGDKLKIRYIKVK